MASTSTELHISRVSSAFSSAAASILALTLSLAILLAYIFNIILFSFSSIATFPNNPPDLTLIMLLMKNYYL